MDRRTDNVKTVYPPQTKFAGGIKICFQDPLSLNADQKYCRMLQESILQYFTFIKLPLVFKTCYVYFWVALLYSHAGPHLLSKIVVLRFFFSKLLRFSKISSAIQSVSEYYKVSNSLDPDQS